MLPRWTEGSKNVAESDGTGRIAPLDGLRFLAFLAVFAFHSLVVPMGWAGVDLFFVLSGFLITSGLLGTRGHAHYFGRFYTRRTFRIFPPFYCYLLITLGVLRPDLWHEWPWCFSMTTNVMEAIQGFFGAGPVCILWSLCVEEHFYLLWPLVVRRVSFDGLQKLVLAGLVAVPLLRMYSGHLFSSHVPIYELLPFRADLLLGGAALAILYIKHGGQLRSFGRPAAIVGVGTLTLFCLLAAQFGTFRASANSVFFNGLGYSLIMIFFASVVLWVLAFPQAWPVRLLGSKWLAYLGKRSYAMYLCHQVVIDSLQAHHVAMSVAALVVIVAIAWVSWRVLEEPFIRLGRRIERALFTDERQSRKKNLSPLTA